MSRCGLLVGVVYSVYRYMLGLAGFPSIVMFIGFLWLPESPRWLIFHGKIVQANKTLHKLRDPKKVADEMTSISKDLDEYKRHQLGEWVWSVVGGVIEF